MRTYSSIVFIIQEKESVEQGYDDNKLRTTGQNWGFSNFNVMNLFFVPKEIPHK